GIHEFRTSRLGFSRRGFLDRRRNDHPPPTFGLAEFPAFEGQVAEQVECSFAGPRAERFVHDPAEQPYVALRSPLVEPLPRLRIDAIAIGRELLGWQRRDSAMTSPARLDGVPRGQGDQVVPGLAYDPLVFIDSLGPLLLASELVRGSDPPSSVGDF